MLYHPPAVVVLKSIVRTRTKGYTITDYGLALVFFVVGVAICIYYDNWTGWPLLACAGVIAWLINFGSDRRRLHYLYMRRWSLLSQSRRSELQRLASHLLYVETLTRGSYTSGSIRTREAALRAFITAWRARNEAYISPRQARRQRTRREQDVGSTPDLHGPQPNG